MKRRLHFLYTTFIALFLIVLSFSFSSNPPNGRTGAPGDGLCTSCHNNSNPNGYNGTIDILNFPSTITPNQTYTLQAQVSVTAGTPSRAGFQAVALNASNNNAGSFSTTDPNVAVTPSGGREYVEHDPAISFGGGSSVVFNFDWTAPNAANGEVITVYTAGLLGNGSGSSNDYTITNTVSGTVSGGGGGGNPPTLSISSTDVSCFNGNNGTATIIASGGTPGYNYSWSNGGNGTSIFNLTAGNYTVTVTDNGGQTATASTLVNQPNPLVPFIVNQTNVDCFGNTTGAATVSSSGGTGNVAFSWSNGTNASTITMVPAGTYTVTATDFNNCTSTTSVTITQPNNINLTATGTNVSCSGANDGSASALGNGGTGGLTYFWSNGASGQTIFNLSAGTYTVTATDNSNCTRTATTTITAPNAIILNLTSTNIDCVGNNNGIASANASGGNGNFSYTWSNGGNGQTISNLPADTYTVTATDANNCTQTESVTITAPNAITLNLTSTNIDCVGNNNGIASANASGGNGNFSYTWSNGENGQTISNLPAGTYTVTATDANNCTQTESVTITAPNAITLNLTSTNIDCVGNNNGIASANASGGNGNFSYTWSNGGNGQTISNLPAGTYTVTATDANNCTQTESVVITAPNAIILNLTSTNIDCVGNNNGIASANASGGNGNFSYTWSNGGNGQTISNLAADTYTVTATDANNCTQTESVTITAPNAIILNLTSTNIDCVGNNNGIASANASGGNGNFSYTWSNGGNTQTISNLAAGTYTVTATDANNCTQTESVTITAPNAITLNLTSTSIDCVGNNNGIASADASGGNGNFSYTWSNGGNGQTISNLPAGTYTVTATDANNCTQTESVVITAPNAITLNLTSTNIDCVGNNNGIASANASVGNGNFSYTWSNGGNGQTISNLPAGTYTVTATDANNCTQMESVTITAPNNLLPNATATNETAAGANDGTATANPSGGTQGYTFLWSTSATTSTISGLAPGTYTVTITDANDCTAMQSVIVGSFNCAVSLGTSVIAPNCFGETGSATASLNNAASPVVFSWSNGATTPTISGVLAGTYTVTATDANNCPATETIIIIEPDELLSNPDITDVSCNGGSDGSVTINATGGTLPYSLTYANGTNTNLAAGNYSATITDANGCTSTVSYQIDEPSAINVNASSTDVTANGVNDGTATATPTGGTSGYTFLWSTGATAASISSLAPDTYTVTVTDANLCTATQSVTVNGFNCTINATASATAILCNGDADGSASVNVDLGTGAAPFTYAWSNGATSATISNLEGGTYTVTVTDANNCPFIGTVTVNEPAPLAISPGNDLNTILECFGDTDGVIDINVQGGTPGYTYLWSNGETTLPLTGLGAGLFTLTITDGNGCTGDVIFNITQPDEISANTFSTDETAANANDGTATATPSGGSGNYTYLWNNNATTASISNLSPGTYTVTVSDSNGCESIETVEVVQFGCALMATAAITNASCADVANGVATLTAMGGNLPISYNWSNGGTTATESDLLPGVYTVTITDGGNCTWIETIEIGVTDVTAPTAIGQDITVSLGTNGTATITPMMIDDGSTDECSMVNLSVDISSFDCSNVGVNPVMLTVTDAANNQSTTTVSVTVIDDTPPTIVCPTDIVVDACTSIVTYGAPIVADNCGAVTFDISGPLTGSTFPFGETTITITATDDSGNETTCDFVINIEHTLTSDIVGTDSPCAGDNLGMASVNAQGSNPNFTYAWSNNATGTEIDNLAPGTYTVTITDDLGCTTTSSVEINEPDPLAITIDNITDETGAGANDGGIEVTIVGGVPPYATSWTLDGNEISQEEDPTQLAGGMYILTITDANGCAVITAEVTVGIMVSNDDLLLEKNIRLYPNPTEENLFLDFDLLGVFDFKIIIQDAIGNVLLENEVENISNDKIEMDVTDFTNGMYFIQVQTEEHVWLRKFIVQKR